MEKMPIIKIETGKEGEKEREKEKAKVNFSKVIDLVNKRYESSDSTLFKSPKQLKSFKEHNQEVLDLCIERGVDKDLSKKELRVLELAAILHDLTKADKPKPGSEVEDIPNYGLAVHGKTGGIEAEKIIKEHPDILSKILGTDYEKKEAEEVRATVKNAIIRHMGPHPGFMDKILSEVNKALKEKGKSEIEHPYPLEGDVVAETLLAADMHSLAGHKGKQKVMIIRATTPFFREQDKNLCTKYKKMDVNLTLGEAALLSSIDSAKQARDMLKNPSDRQWIEGVIEDSKKKEYFYKDEPVNYLEAIIKKRQFEDVT